MFVYYTALHYNYKKFERIIKTKMNFVLEDERVSLNSSIFYVLLSTRKVIDLPQKAIFFTLKQV